MTERRQTLEQFYVVHRDRLLVSALAVTRRRDLAEDAIQNVFLRLFRRLWLPRNLKGYIFRSVRNAAIDALPRRSGKALQGRDGSPKDLLCPPGRFP